MLVSILLLVCSLSSWASTVGEPDPADIKFTIEGIPEVNGKPIAKIVNEKVILFSDEEMAKIGYQFNQAHEKPLLEIMLHIVNDKRTKRAAEYKRRGIKEGSISKRIERKYNMIHISFETVFYSFGNPKIKGYYSNKYLMNNLGLSWDNIVNAKKAGKFELYKRTPVRKTVRYTVAARKPESKKATPSKPAAPAAKPTEKKEKTKKPAKPSPKDIVYVPTMLAKAPVFPLPSDGTQAFSTLSYINNAKNKFYEPIIKTVQDVEEILIPLNFISKQEAEAEIAKITMEMAQKMKLSVIANRKPKGHKMQATDALQPKPSKFANYTRQDLIDGAYEDTVDLEDLVGEFYVGPAGQILISNGKSVSHKNKDTKRISLFTKKQINDFLLVDVTDRQFKQLQKLEAKVNSFIGNRKSTRSLNRFIRSQPDGMLTLSDIASTDADDYRLTDKQTKELAKKSVIENVDTTIKAYEKRFKKSFYDLSYYTALSIIDTRYQLPTLAVSNKSPKTNRAIAKNNEAEVGIQFLCNSNDSGKVQTYIRFSATVSRVYESLDSKGKQYFDTRMATYSQCKKVSVRIKRELNKGVVPLDSEHRARMSNFFRKHDKELSQQLASL